jgi:hypothetical protein
MSVLSNALRLSQNDAATAGGKVMEWFSQKTSIAGYQIPNWALVLAVVIVLFLIYFFLIDEFVA